MAWHYLWICLLFLQTWLEATGRDTDLIMVNGILGESVTFPLNIQEPQSINNIAWTSGTSVAVIKPRDSGAAPEILVTHNNYHERITVISQNYSLVLSNLRMEDAGDYKADINIKADTTTKTSPRTITKHFHLGVYRRLGKPKITQSLMTSENSTCNVTLTCSVDEEEKNVTYTWSTQKSENNVLQVLQTPENKDMIYTCTASNPVSNNSSSISAQQLCADAASDPSAHGSRLLKGLAVLFLLALIPPSLLLFYLHKRRRGFHWKAFNKKSDAASEKIIYASVSAPRDTQPAEARIYDEISQSKEFPSTKEPVSTIYSIVQYSDKGRRNQDSNGITAPGKTAPKKTNESDKQMK